LQKKPIILRSLLIEATPYHLINKNAHLATDNIFIVEIPRGRRSRFASLKRRLKLSPHLRELRLHLVPQQYLDITVSTENATSPKSTISKNSNLSVQIQIKPKSHLEFVLRDTKESEFLDLVDFGEVAKLVESVIYRMAAPSRLTQHDNN